MSDKQQPGINFRELDNGRLRQNIHWDTFIAYMKPFVNENGWLSIELEKLKEPTDKGYTHRFWHVLKKTINKAA